MNDPRGAPAPREPGDPRLDAVVAAAGRGEEKAWLLLVGRYTPLVYAVISDYRLSRPDAADANQSVWLRLVEQLSHLRDPQALPAWLVTTTRNECLRVLRDTGRTTSVDPLDSALDAGLDGAATVGPDDGVDSRLLAAERHQVLRDGLGQIPSRCQQLLTLLVADPPPTYEDISTRIGIPVGSIGPTRARCLEKLRTCPAVLAWREAGARVAEKPGGGRRDVATVG